MTGDNILQVDMPTGLKASAINCVQAYQTQTRRDAGASGVTFSQSRNN